MRGARDLLSPALRRAVHARDGERCRWCGATNRGVDLHHINYRRGVVDDVVENLVSLCRGCHSFVHGNPRGGTGIRITKDVAQQMLLWVTVHPGTTAASRWRAQKRRWALDGLCEHGQKVDACQYSHGRMRG